MRVEGRIEAIHLRPTSDADPVATATARVVAGKGLEGDRYYFEQGARRGEALTLIEAEALEGLAADTGIRLSAGDSRRQVLTRGIDLNALIGQEFTVGAVRCLGVELCEPCNHLQSLTAPGVLGGLVHRAGRVERGHEGDEDARRAVRASRGSRGRAATRSGAAPAFLRGVAEGMEGSGMGPAPDPRLSVPRRDGRDRPQRGGGRVHHRFRRAKRPTRRGCGCPP